MTSDFRIVRPGWGLALALVIAVVASGCASFERGEIEPEEPAPNGGGDNGSGGNGADGVVDLPDGGGGGDDGTGGGLSFATSAHPILMAQCSTCHTSGGPAGSTPLVMTGDAGDDYDVVLGYVTVSKPESSFLLEKGTAKSAHGGGAVLTTTSEAYATLVDWIAGGAMP